MSAWIYIGLAAAALLGLIALLARVFVGLIMSIIRGPDRSFADRRDLDSGGWPNHHCELREKVAQAIAKLAEGSAVCGVESYYLPHGGKDEMWITLTSLGGTISRKRTPYQGQPVETVRQIDAGESAGVRAKMEQLGIWSLSHFKRSTHDGWPCAIAIADHNRIHSIQTHNPEGDHLRLIEYLLGLV
jgi:hypothetical protein